MKLSPCVVFRKNAKSISRQLRPASGISSCGWTAAVSMGCRVLGLALVISRANPQVAGGWAGAFQQHGGRLRPLTAV